MLCFFVDCHVVLIGNTGVHSVVVAHTLKTHIYDVEKAKCSQFVYKNKKLGVKTAKPGLKYKKRC